MTIRSLISEVLQTSSFQFSVGSIQHAKYISLKTENQKLYTTGLSAKVMFLSLVLLISPTICSHSAASADSSPELAKPSPKQIAFADWEVGAFFTVGLGANTIINLPLDTTGRIPDDISAAAKALGDEIRKRFSNPIAQAKGVMVGDTIELTWRTPTEINTIVIMENIAHGQKVVKYSLEAFVDGRWQALEPRNRLISQKPYTGNPGYETIGHKKIDRVKPVTTNRIRFRAVETIAKPVELRLKTTVGGNNGNSDHALWADAKLIE